MANSHHLYQRGDDIPIQLSARPVSAVQPELPETSPESEATLPQVFTLSKTANSVFVVDETPLAPNKAVQLGGAKFEAMYEAQLRSLLYNDFDKLDHHSLMVITSLFDIAEQTKRPIRLMSQAFRKKLPTVCFQLNAFYRSNHAVICGISKQMNDSL